ncbi:MAG TPA: MmgE/PrpD family protein [Candidatus Margulisiibacteriota bacterium]|nr:MmgE/PrpD family protein [Candidatus Margulisiibacteriota bacterium]
MTRALVDAVRGLRYDAIPEDAREVARHCLLDFLGTTLAGAREPLADILVEQIVRAEGATEAGLIGRRERATRLTAALVNGAAGHALDFDDTHTTMSGHPSVPVLPALLALGETEGAGGRALLAALVAGIELECRLGALLGFGHYAAGFHSTGTVGTFGAAAACAHLLGLDENGWLNALGLAGTQAAGLKSGFGTMAKPLHAGRAASAGLLSAVLARAGFTAQPAVIEVPQGFAATHAGAEPSISALGRYAGRFLIRETLFKYHAACYLTHAAIEAAVQLRDQHGFECETISSVEVHVSPALLGVCNIESPTTGLEGKFSLRATTALALLGEDTGDPATYSDDKMAAPDLMALRDRVHVVPTDELAPTQARVAVESKQQRVEAAADAGLPSADLGRQREQLRRKFLGLATPVLGGSQAARLAAAALSAQEMESIEDLIHLARPQ